MKRLRRLFQYAPSTRPVQGERLVLTIGDEGAILVHLRDGRALNRLFSPAPDSEESAALTEFAESHASAPLYVVLDTVDQAYVPQTLPPVTSFSVKKLISRRVEREFQGDYISGAMAQGREKEGRRDWRFMLAAAQKTPAVKAWLDLCLDWPNRCAGFFLMPLEAMEVAKRLEAALIREEGAGKPAPIVLLVSDNKVSGTRQLVMREGQITLTRLGQHAFDTTAEAMAGIIEQEVVSTREYMRRLSFHEEDVSRTIIIVSEEIRRHIDPSRLRSEYVHALTPHEAAGVLGIEGATQPGDRYGDALLSASIGLSRRHVLTLASDELKRLDTLYKSIRILRMAVLAIALGLLFYTGDSALNVVSMKSDMRALEKQRIQRQSEFQALKDRAASAPEDLEKIADVVDMYERLSLQSYQPFPLFKKVAETLGANARVILVSWALHESATTAPGKAGQAQVEAKFTIEFDNSLVRDRGALQAASVDLLNALKTALPQHEVVYDSLPPAISDSNPITINVTQDGARVANDPVKAAALQAKMTIRGPVEGESIHAPR